MGIEKVQFCPMFIKTQQGEYVNANNVARIKQTSGKNYVAEVVEGPNFISTYLIDESEAKKLVDFYA